MSTATAIRRPAATRVQVPGRRIRVAQIVTKFTAGAGGVTLRGALALDQDRYSTTVFAADGGSLIEPAKEAGLEVVVVPQLAGGRGIYPWVDLRAMRQLSAHLAAGDFDLVHTNSAKAGALGRLASRSVGVGAVVHTFHGFPFHSFQSPPVRGSLLSLERRLGRLTDYFLAAGTVTAADAVRLKIAEPERIRSIAPPIEAHIPAVTETARRHARQLLRIPTGAKVVGTTARLDAQKAPLDMVAAFAALKRPDLHMIWIGDGELRAKTERLIEREGIRDRFHLIGNRTDVASLLPAFDVFAMSSLYEGLPCAVAEAMAAGIPVVATTANSVPEIVLAGKTGLLARPGDPSSLSRALGYMLDHPHEASRMASAARAYIGGRFRPDAFARDLTEAYELALRFGAERTSGAQKAQISR
jgi:glycosyltransferase involved in cell wall biosynthesis